MTNLLFTLLGAALVASGVLCAAVADRIRGIRLTREKEIAPRRAAQTAPAVEPVEAELVEPEAVKRKPRGESKTQTMQTMAGEVVAALVAAGYKKSTAAEAVWGCGAAERASLESWTAAALRKCAKGGLS